MKKKRSVGKKNKPLKTKKEKETPAVTKAPVLEEQDPISFEEKKKEKELRREERKKIEQKKKNSDMLDKAIFNRRQKGSMIDRFKTGIIAILLSGFVPKIYPYFSQNETTKSVFYAALLTVYLYIFFEMAYIQYYHKNNPKFYRSKFSIIGGKEISIVQAFRVVNIGILILAVFALFNLLGIWL